MKNKKATNDQDTMSKQNIEDTDKGKELTEEPQCKEEEESQCKEEEEPLEIANKQIEELKDKYLRAVAEFDNYRKRTLKEKAELILNGSEKTVMAILPIMDDMERALISAESTDDLDVIKEGLNLICAKFEKTLESLGVKKIETKDLAFNTDQHEAVAMIPSDEEEKGKVLDCIQTGYTLNGKVIRHAKVAVGQ